MLVKEFIEEFKNKKVQNTKLNEHAVEDFLKETLEIKTYLPFNAKRAMVEAVVAQTINEEDGIKKVDNISQYLGFVCAALITYTNLELSDNPANDYDELSKDGLLESIIEVFQKDYAECNALLKMAVASELEDNNFNIIVGKFLNNILNMLNNAGEAIKGFTENIDISKLLGANISEENIAKILGFVDKYIK